MIPSGIDAQRISPDSTTRCRALLLCAMSAWLVVGCALFRTDVVLTGNVLELQYDTALVSVHSTEGAHAGMQFAIYQVNLIPAIKVTAPPRRHPQRTGEAVLTEIIGDHAVRVRITGGTISRDHDVELRGHR